MNKNGKRYVSESILQKIKEKFDFGRGVEITLSTRHPDTGTTYDYYFSSKLPKLEVKTTTGKRLIDVEVSSIEEEDQKLLHYLHNQISRS